MPADRPPVTRPDPVRCFPGSGSGSGSGYCTTIGIVVGSPVRLSTTEPYPHTSQPEVSTSTVA